MLGKERMNLGSPFRKKSDDTSVTSSPSKESSSDSPGGLVSSSASPYKTTASILPARHSSRTFVARSQERERGQCTLGTGRMGARVHTLARTHAHNHIYIYIYTRVQPPYKDTLTHIHLHIHKRTHICNPTYKDIRTPYANTYFHTQHTHIPHNTHTTHTHTKHIYTHIYPT